MSGYSEDGEQQRNPMKPKRSEAKSAEVVDVPADNPVGTMDRFSIGLRRVLSAPKPSAPMARTSPSKRRSRKTRGG
jgi:hypothetical protein